MTPQELKLSILSQAFQGKLVAQLSEEGVGTDLLPVIQAECYKKISSGQIKKFKTLSAIADADVDFDVPDTWHLIRLGSICQLLDGEKRSGEAYPYLEARYLRGKTEPTILTEGKYVTTGTNVILVDGENSGEVFCLTESGYMGSTFKVLFVPEALLLKYVIYFLQYHKNTLRNNKKGAAIPHLNKDIFFNLVLPLPPLAEQKRIVTKIEELLPLIDRYEAAWSKLADFNKRFPADMQKSILQMAIQGKLVPQLPEESTGEELYQQIQEEKQSLIKAGKIKKEKPLPEITEDEIPFDIPDSWKWVRLQSICSLIGDIDHNMPKSVDSKDGVLFLSAKDLLDDGTINYTNNVKYISYTDFERLSKKALPRRNDIIYSRIGAALGKARVVESDIRFLVSYSCCTIRPLLIDVKFLRYYLESPLILAHSIKARQSIGVPDLGMGEIKKYLIALPPMEEQKRIVAKLEEILPLCERLK